MVDSGITAGSLPESWTGFGRRIAVASGALIGLVSQLAGAPVWVASLRGGATFVAVALTIRLSRLALEFASHAEPPIPTPEQEADEEPSGE